MPPALSRFSSLALLAVLASTPFAPAAEIPASDSRKASRSEEIFKFSAARSGNEVLLSWDAPEMDVHLLEIMRNTRRDQKSRGRVASVRVRPGHYADHVTDTASTYWYWLKLTRPDGRVINVGPVQTPPAEVWRPAE